MYTEYGVDSVELGRKVATVAIKFVCGIKCLCSQRRLISPVVQPLFDTSLESTRRIGITIVDCLLIIKLLWVPKP